MVIEDLGTVRTAVPRALDIGLRVPADLEGWHFRKTPVYLRAGAPPLTLTTSAPAAVAVAWVPAAAWTSGEAPNLSGWAAASVTLTGCPDRDAVYFGGLLARTPQTCLQLTATDPAPDGLSPSHRLDGDLCA